MLMRRIELGRALGIREELVMRVGHKHLIFTTIIC